MPYKNPQDKKDQMARWRKENPDYSKKYWEKNGKKYTKYSTGRTQRYASKENNKIKIKARNAVYYALKTGSLVKPNYCQKCGKIAKLEADHRDYNKPLAVVWLCKPCHQWYTTNQPII